MLPITGQTAPYLPRKRNSPSKHNVLEELFEQKQDDAWVEDNEHKQVESISKRKKYQKKKWFKRGLIGTLICGCVIIVVYWDGTILKIFNWNRRLSSSSMSLQQFAGKVLTHSGFKHEEIRLDIPGLTSLYGCIYIEQHGDPKTVYIEFIDKSKEKETKAVEIEFNKGGFKYDDIGVVDAKLVHLYTSATVSGSKWLEFTDELFAALNAGKVRLINLAKKDGIPIDLIKAIHEESDTYYGKRGYECTKATKNEVNELMAGIRDTLLSDLPGISSKLQEMNIPIPNRGTFGPLMKQLWSEEDKTKFNIIYQYMNDNVEFPEKYNDLRKKCEYMVKDYRSCWQKCCIL